MNPTYMFLIFNWKDLIPDQHDYLKALTRNHINPSHLFHELLESLAVSYSTNTDLDAILEEIENDIAYSIYEREFKEKTLYWDSQIVYHNTVKAFDTIAKAMLKSPLFTKDKGLAYVPVSFKNDFIIYKHKDYV